MTDEEPKSNVLISISPQLEQDLRDLAKILFPDKTRGGLSLTAEQAIRGLAQMEKYKGLLADYRKLRKRAEDLRDEVVKCPKKE